MAEPTTLVIVKCYTCGTILDRIDTPPDDWTGSYSFPRCRSRRCPSSVPSGERWFEGTGRYALAGLIPWSALRPNFEEAWKRGKASTTYVRIAKLDEDTR